MNRFTKHGLALLLAVTITACDEGTPPIVEPPPEPAAVGTISGAVTIEGTAASGVTATLSSGATTTTGSGGNFAFSGVEEGTYTVTISGFPEDVTFAEVTQSATIATDGQNVQLNFAGEYIRSSAVVGNVVAADAMMSGGDGQPETLAGVTVTLGGEHAMGETMETDETGGFAFTGLRAGTYTVTISDYPADVSFETVMVEVAVEVGDVGQADFTGHFIRTSAVEGQVIIEGEGLAGVTVTLSGGPADESYTIMTDADGMYRFEELRPGAYTVSISDFDARDYEFASTSRDVDVDLDETSTVSFTGVLLRTSGISGRVSVEGMGLGEITVTLAGADDRTAMTDAGGQYSFAGLAAGDYTVSIAVESAAYVFESMSTDVAVGDDESAIINFEGAHARTASVSGMAYVDEATKNDMFDEGEHPLAHAGLPVVLVGPGVNEQRVSLTDSTGAFSFTGLRAGPYQLVVTINATVAAALAANDLAYGGPGEGYAVALGVGEAVTQSVPFDITHTRVNFTASLRSGEEMGAALPGAIVDFFSDAAGETKIGSGMTGEEGSVMIRVARAGTSGNMVHASVSADGYHVADGMTVVSWNPQYNMAAGANENDIVNLNVDVAISGATVTTEYGGGDALANWAISVMAGEDSVAGAPEKLDTAGVAAFTTTVGADDLPATFTIAVDDDQANTLDGGESYDGGSVEYTHTGLMLAGTQNADMIEVAFTTQTLKVYVHHELDQVEGYTGNIIGGDERDGKGADRKVDVDLRYIDDSGRSRAFTAADSISEPKDNGDGGAWVFSNVPADMNVIANASKADNTDLSIMILDEGGHADELAAYTGTDANGITGGHFGAQGGYSHTVSLCPLQDTNPQDHDACSSFAYVSTHSVSGLIWKNVVVKSTETANDDRFSFGKTDGVDVYDPEGAPPTFVAGISVSLSPVEGKNLAGDEESHTTTDKPVRGPGETAKGNEVLDETHQFAFNNIAAGVYKASVTDGWRARLGPKGATAMVGNAFNPLAGDVSLDVTPATTTVYGYVKDAEEFPVDSVNVNVNGVVAMTDVHGRYIAEYVPNVASRKIGTVTHTNSVFVETAQGGSGETRNIQAFAANSRIRQDVDLSGVGTIASISGTVTASGSGAPIAGAEIKVDGNAPTNAAKTGANRGKLVTGADGTYTAEFAAKDLGESADVTVSKDGMSFAPATLSVPAHAGSAVSGINFTGFQHATISGRVRGPGGNAMGGVTVTATNVVAGAAGDDVLSTSNARGTFVLSVPFGAYDIEASLANHSFKYPNDNQRVSVAPGQSLNFGAIEALSPGARNLSASRARTEDDESTEDIDESERYNGNISVKFVDSATDVPEGFTSPATHEVQHNYTGTFTDASATLVTRDSLGNTVNVPGSYTFTSPGDTTFMVRVVTSVAHPTDSDLTFTIESDPVTVGAVDPSTSGVTASRAATADTTVADTLTVTWDADSNTSSEFRIMVEVASENTGSTLWLVASGGEPTTIASTTRSWSLEWIHDFTASWNTVGGTAIAITDVELNKPFRVRVDSRQGSAGDFTEGTPVSVP